MNEFREAIFIGVSKFNFFKNFRPFHRYIQADLQTGMTVWALKFIWKNDSKLVLTCLVQQVIFPRNKSILLIILHFASFYSYSYIVYSFRTCRNYRLKDVTNKNFMFNSFVPNWPFLYPMKTSENLKVIRG